MLLRAVLPEHVDHVLRADGLEVEVERRRPAGMVLQHLVRLRVAKTVERDAVHRRLIGIQFVIRNPVGFDQLYVQRHVRSQIRVLRHDGEGLAVLAPRHPHRA